jgi:arylsulfatase
MPLAPESSETFDVGSDTGTGVDDEDYQTPFAFDGKLDTLAIEPPKLTPEDEKKLDEGMRGAADAK